MWAKINNHLKFCLILEVTGYGSPVLIALTVKVHKKGIAHIMEMKLILAN